jgi:hypothetical protein
MTTNPAYRIQEIRKATVNGCKVKIFKAYRYSPMADAYIFDGQYTVPQRTANKHISAMYETGNIYRAAHANKGPQA